ncbi:MAG TPA: hypothetical protein VGO52_26045 [Hyphomonadaceae bacterium]|jgi:hypothetical protein|nr:hypothetical protein [Hyphomonadaceae bacterium]
MRNFICLALIAVAAASPAAAQKYVGSPSAKEIAYIENETKAVRDRLKDPKSAEFSKLFVSRKSGAPIVCGYVNSKNGFGGFTGAQRFVGASGAGITVTEEDMAKGEMANLWAKVC